jgi:hypothetical protein
MQCGNLNSKNNLVCVWFGGGNNWFWDNWVW